MLPEPSAPVLSEIDVEVFDRLVKPNHYVRRASELMDFERFRPILARYYSPDQGRPKTRCGCSSWSFSSSFLGMLSC